MIEIDGSFGEGGGQILRTAVSIGAVLGSAVRVFNIRAKRENPGIRPQHHMAIKAVAEMSSAIVEGNDVGSSQISFIPGNLRGGRFAFDIGTAGSVTLVIQSVIPVAVASRSHTWISVTGGTDVPGGPTSDYLENVLVKAVNWMGGKVSYVLRKRGYYPRGGGAVEVEVERGTNLKDITLLQRDSVTVTGKSQCSRLPPHVAKRQAASAKDTLWRSGIEVGDIAERCDHESLDPGSSITLWVDADGVFMGTDSLGARAKRAEEVGADAARKMIAELATEAPVDSHMGDMLLPYLLLSAEPSTVRVSSVSMHLLTEAYVARKFPGLTVELNGGVGETGIFRVSRHGSVL